MLTSHTQSWTLPRRFGHLFLCLSAISGQAEEHILPAANVNGVCAASFGDLGIEEAHGVERCKRKVDAPALLLDRLWPPCSPKAMKNFVSIRRRLDRSIVSVTSGGAESRSIEITTRQSLNSNESHQVSPRRHLNPWQAELITFSPPPKSRLDCKHHFEKCLAGKCTHGLSVTACL